MKEILLLIFLKTSLVVVIGPIAFANNVSTDRLSQLSEELDKMIETEKFEDANSKTSEAKALARTFYNYWDSGNAMHKAELVLGHVALAGGDVEKAEKHLLKAGNVSGSPQLNSFGPNMKLAKKLLERKQKETVLKYFESVKKFWKTKDALETLDQWTKKIEKGEIPDFTGNLLY